MPKYTLTVNIEERGTMHTDRNKNTTNPSMAGHMWLGASDGVNKPLEFGFASERGMPFDIGVLKDDDNSSYAGEPRYSKTTEITKEQFDRFRDIHENRALSNFDFNNYNAITNNCVAHTWSVLNEIGIETGGFLGELMPNK
ncbi:hypothetical protein [Campylobacter majalis]|uniref:hypothetical protein n=1 Tax=Campylobacter majalis TaxID=2790656 RepID=UPI003D687B79